MVRPDLGKYRITQRYGVNEAYYGKGGHTGVDLGTPTGSPVYASATGKVTHINTTKVGGLYVRILSTDGTIYDGFSVYTGHMSRAGVSIGQKVVEGQVIGLSGTSGVVTGPHTHWTVWDKNGKLVDPLSLKLNEGGSMEKVTDDEIRILARDLEHREKVTEGYLNAYRGKTFEEAYRAMSATARHNDILAGLDSLHALGVDITGAAQKIKGGSESERIKRIKTAWIDIQDALNQ